MDGEETFPEEREVLLLEEGGKLHLGDKNNNHSNNNNKKTNMHHQQNKPTDNI